MRANLPVWWGSGEQGREPRDDHHYQRRDVEEEQHDVVRDVPAARSFWIRAKQYTPGPITCAVCGQDFQPQNASHQDQAR
jgi:hypothetical protein